MSSLAISVIVPVYNVEKYLDEMLASIYKQTFEDFNIIIVNDGSTDNSEGIIKKYVNLYKDKTIYIKQENAGVSVARNTAIPFIKGKYTLFLDPDDYIREDMFQKMYDRAERTSADIVMCGYEKVYDYENNDSNRQFLHDVEEQKQYSSYEVMNKMLDLEVKGYLWNKLFITENVMKYRMHFAEGRLIQDWAPVFEQVSVANKIVFINEPLYFYRQRQSSNLHRKNIKQIEDFNVAVKTIINYIVENNIEVAESKFYSFIADSQTSQIRDYVNLGRKCNEEIYKRCEIIALKLWNIIFKIKTNKRAKIKLILFKLRLLHKAF